MGRLYSRGSARILAERAPFRILRAASRHLPSNRSAPREILHPAKAGVQDDAGLGVSAFLRHSSLDGVILNGLQAVKDLARVGRNVGPLNAPEESQSREDPRQILHPAEAGLRMTHHDQLLLFLLAADDQAVDADGRTCHGAAKFQVAGDFGNVEEHLFQISGHRNLFDGIGQLAAGNP